MDVAAAVTVLARRDVRAGEYPDLHQTSLTRLELPDSAQFSNANLSSVDFRCASLRGAHFEDARLGGAWMVWADLTGADLHGAKGLDKVVWLHTTCPDGSGSHKVRKESDRETCVDRLELPSKKSSTPKTGEGQAQGSAVQPRGARPGICRPGALEAVAPTAPSQTHCAEDLGVQG
ncbi:pentapeptide repeat-containing protein [Streptomyces lydicus]|uniref:pentapeptide repeat-containing protein n=1 Tax=Streptomyces lydicus TaxID=47763 RepID=UPI0037A3BB1E